MPHGGPQKLDGAITYTAADGPESAVMIDERRCIDPQSGSLFAYAVEVRSEGAHSSAVRRTIPAMPAP